MELWDLIDENRKPIGETHRRGEPLKSGAYHLAVEIWTINSKGEVLLTLRAPEKHVFPNKWENTAGSVISGEISIEAAMRELGEETGIHLLQNDFYFLGTCMEGTAFMDSYLVFHDRAVEALSLQPGETVDAKWVSFETLDQMIENGDVAESVAIRLSYVRQAIEEQISRTFP